MSAQTIYEYYYRIRDVVTGIYYSGSKYSNSANPKTFWKEGGYFTSSSIILDLVDKYGPERFEVCKLLILKDSYSFETKFLQRVDAKNNPLFYNQHNNEFGKNTAFQSGENNIIHNEEIKNKAAAKRNITMRDSKWKDTIWAKGQEKTQKTINDPMWKKSVGVEKEIKRFETLAKNGKTGPRSKPVLFRDKEFSSIKEASLYFRCCVSYVKRDCVYL